MYYLSIDLDYFNVGSQLDYKLLGKLAKRQVPTKVVLSHEHIVPHVKTFTSLFDTLVNLDYHSDLCSTVTKKGNPAPKLPLNEGTWGNHIPCSSSKLFVWSPPATFCKSHESGYCHGERYPNPFFTPHHTWQAARIRTKWVPPLTKVVAASICLSDKWTQWNLLENFFWWCKKAQPSFEWDELAIKFKNRMEEI